MSAKALPGETREGGTPPAQYIARRRDGERQPVWGKVGYVAFCVLGSRLFTQYFAEKVSVIDQ